MSLSDRLVLLAGRVAAEVKSLRAELPKPNRYRAYRPKTINFTPGIGSIMEGRYYFDGVQVHVELPIQMAVHAMTPMGTAPAIVPPSEIDLNADPVRQMLLGVGIMHDATTGIIHPLAAIVKTATAVEFFSMNGSAYATITPSVPTSWGILDGIRVKFSYIPKNKVAPRNFTAYGDSITRFETNAGDTWSWVNHVPVEGLTFGGGYALDGGTSAQVLAGAKKINADVGVCMVGVNDIAQGVPLGTTTANVVALHAKVATDRFVLCKIAPYDANSAASNAMNAAYQALADTHGWTLLDPFAAHRGADGRWVAGASYDGVHPNLPVQQAAAGVIRAAIQSL